MPKKKKEFQVVDGVERAPVKSSQIKSMGFVPDKKILEVEFLKGGKVYQYHPVTQAQFNSIMDAESKGKEFYKVIKSDASIEYKPKIQS